MTNAQNNGGASAPSAVAVTKELSKLVAEYRPSMDAEVLHSWAKDITAALSALSAQPAVAVVDGWKLVPVEPTEAMKDDGRVAQGLASGLGEDWQTQVGDIYRAMLAAAPQPAPQPVAVKPMEWEDGFIASTPFGAYTISDNADDRWVFSYHTAPYAVESDDDYETEAEAKAAAQADYERRILSALTSPPADQQENERHPDDLAVDRFAAAMKTKLAKKREEGRGGWDDKQQCNAEFLSRLLREHVEKGDPLDVGNLAMMLHQRGEKIV